MYIECHIHISLDGLNFNKSRQLCKSNDVSNIMRNTLKKYKKNGIYAIRDGGDNLGASVLAKEIAKEEGIIYKSPVYALYKKGLYGSFLGKSINDINDFKIEFDILKKKRLDHLKIPLTNMVNFKKYGDVGEIAFTLDELSFIVDTAKDSNIPVMVHANSKDAVDIAIKAGVSTIEHGYFMTERELYGIAKKDIIWVPTLTPLGNILYSKDERYKSEMPLIERIYREQIENVNKAFQIGVKMAIGSDAGAYKVPHVSGFFNEINYFQEAGIVKDDILKMAFENGIKALSLNEDEINYLTSLKAIEANSF